MSARSTPRPHVMKRRRNKTLGTALGAVACLATVGLSSADASAKIPTELRPGTKPHYFEFGPTAGHSLGPHGTHANGWLNYLYHFRGGPEGPALGAVLVGGGWNKSYRLMAGALFEWDFKLIPSKALGLYLGPHVAGGYGFRHRGRDGRLTSHGFQLTAGPTVKLLLNDFWSFWVRPINVDLLIGRDFGPGLTGALGAGITF